jgi:hypothetical protein
MVSIRGRHKAKTKQKIKILGKEYATREFASMHFKAYANMYGGDIGIYAFGVSKKVSSESAKADTLNKETISIWIYLSIF